MVNFVSQKYDNIKLTGKKIQKSVFNEIIEDAKNKFNIDEIISIRTIQSRYCRKNIVVKHRGTATPMAPLEPALLEIVIQKSKMNQPLTVDNALQLANSMIKPGSEVEANIVSYLKSRGQYSMKGSTTKSPGSLLGAGYWAGFRRRHKDVLLYQNMVCNLDIIGVSGASTITLKLCTTSFTRPWRLQEWLRSWLNLSGKMEWDTE